MRHFSFPIFFVIIILLTRCKASDRYDLVLKNGSVLDVKEGVFKRQNVAVNQGKIVAIGDQDFSGKVEIDATDQYIYPGFIDAHCHFFGYASALLAVNLVGTTSFAEVMQRTRTFAEEHPDITFITGRGWDQNDWKNNEFPDKKQLDSLFPAIPVLLTRIDGHAALANSKALQLADSLPENMPGGKVHYVDGEPTGLLIDHAISLIPVPLPDREAMNTALLQAESNCFKVGLTGLADAGLDKDAIHQLEELQAQGSLKMPLYIMIEDNPADYLPFLEKGPIKTDRLSVASIKVYGDGALGSRGALLLESYTDDPMNYGLMLKDSQDLRQLCEKALRAKFQVNVHAIGDSANRLVLKTFASVLPPQNDARWRIEHAQVVHPSDSFYFQQYKIVPSVQPTHATSDMYWVEERLGKSRVHHAYAFQSLMQWSGVLPLGTDFPVEDIDPLKTFYAAVMRQDSLGFPAAGFVPEQRLSRINALRGMTIWAAFAQFQENETGSIDMGKWANFVCMPVDLLHCAPEDILKAEVLKTIIHGEVVYNKQSQ